MFDDIKRFEIGSSQQLDWFRQLLDGFLPDGSAMDIRAVPRGSFPMINLARSDDAVRVYVFAAGLAPSDLTIDIQDNVLTLRGLDAERAEAHHAHGVFEIVLPKREELKPRRIDVQAA